LPTPILEKDSIII